MSKRVVYKDIPKNNFADRDPGDSPFVDFKVSEEVKEKKIKLKLIGTAIKFVQYSPYKKKPKGEVGPDQPFPFADAHLNNKKNRYGDVDDPSCPWKKGGWQGQVIMATNCLQHVVVDGEKKWVPKILSKGNSIFSEFSKWELGRLQEVEDTGNENLSLFLGGKMAPIVTITATYAPKKMGKVEYQVFMSSSDLEVNGEMIESLRAVGEPTPENLKSAKQEFKEGYPDEKWYDFYAFGYPLEIMFKPSPMLSESEATVVDDDEEEIDLDDLEEAEEEKSIDLDDDDEEEAKPSKPAKKASSKASKTNDDEDDDLDINW